MANPFLSLGFNSWSRKFSRGIPAAALAFLEYLTIPAISAITIKSTGTVNYEVDWGDGSTESSTTNNLTHNYSSAGQYTIKISPAEGSTYLPYFSGTSGGGGEEDKLLEINGTGGAPLSATYLSYAWSGSSTLTSFSDNIDFSNINGFHGTWQFSTALTTFPLIDTSSVTYMQYAWQGCTALTTFPLIDTSNVTNFFATWLNCSSLTSIPAFDLSSATNISLAFGGCTSLVDVPVLTFSSGLSSASSAFNNCALSAQSIENILVAWDNCGASNVSTSVAGGTSAAYSTWSSAAQTALSNLQGKGWTITYNT